jgi:hypothetical protein
MEDRDRPGLIGSAFFTRFKGSPGSFVHIRGFGKKYGFLYTKMSA